VLVELQLGVDLDSQVSDAVACLNTGAFDGNIYVDVGPLGSDDKYFRFVCSDLQTRFLEPVADTTSSGREVLFDGEIFFGS